MASDAPVLIGIIGGSGVYKMDCLENPTYQKIVTPYGEPSDEVCIATVRGVRCAFLPRHGRDHIFLPSEVNYQANIYALKTLGVKYLISICAVGSLDAAYRPGDLALVDQLIDKTTLRKATFFGGGVVGHVPFGHPTCPQFRELAYDAMCAALPGIAKGEFQLHQHATMVTMEGPVFSTKAEALANKSAGGHLVGMTAATESKLAREAGMAHLIVSMVTDMDAWQDEPCVDVSKVIATLHANAAKAQAYPPAIIEALGQRPFESDAFSAMQYAVMTKASVMSEANKKKFQPLFGKYLGF